MSNNIKRLRDFVTDVAVCMDDPQSSQEPWLLEKLTPKMAELVAHDDWLPEAMAQGGVPHYRQYLLYGDPRNRFSLLSYVWGPGQGTPIHDHTVWGVIGCLRGNEFAQKYERFPSGRMVPLGKSQVFKPGDVTAVSPAIGDIHLVRNPSDAVTAISIHLYGANIGITERNVYAEADGRITKFKSGYSSDMVPNLWPDNHD